MISKIALILALAQTPGYEAFTKRELWETAEKYSAKYDVAMTALNGCEDKLHTRTATVINQLVLPQAADEPLGHRTEIVILVGGVALVVGVVIGLLAAPKSTPPVTVVR